MVNYWDKRRQHLFVVDYSYTKGPLLTITAFLTEGQCVFYKIRKGSLHYTGVLISPQPDQEGNKLGSMSGTRVISTTSRRELSLSFLFFLQGKAPKEIHAILTETLACFLPGRAKELSAPLYGILLSWTLKLPDLRCSSRRGVAGGWGAGGGAAVPGSKLSGNIKWKLWYSALYFRTNGTIRQVGSSCKLDYLTLWTPS